MLVLPSSTTGSEQQLATGDESGQIRTWDFYADDPVVCEYKEQEDVINDLALYKKYFLAASGDGTLAAYDFRNRQLKLKSEPMHSELLSIAITDKYTYVGALDNHIEVFINDQYGNILERMETKFLMGVDAIVALRDNLLLAASANDDTMRFYHVNPNKALQSVPNFGGVERFVMTHNKKYLFSVSADVTLRVCLVDDLVKDVPTIRAQDLGAIKKNEKKAKKNELKDEFFKDLVVQNGKHDSDEDVDESDMEVDDEEQAEDEEVVGDEDSVEDEEEDFESTDSDDA
ncbi:y44f5a.1 [Aphelenchoides avenae]|nr:y44f5a.1 [Aphelenchus avenae]